MPPTVSYLPSAKKARVMAVNIGAQVLKHGDILQSIGKVLGQHAERLDASQAVLARGFFGRLSWLLRGK